jgi:hypothetical protein
MSETAVAKASRGAMFRLCPDCMLLVAMSIAAAVPMLFSGCGPGRVQSATEQAISEPSESSQRLPGNNGEVAGKSPPLAPGAKTLALARAGDRPYDKTFDDIRFDIQPGQPFQRAMLPETIEALVGQRIRIRGYILPTAQKRGIKQFVLVRDNQECCFGPGAALYDCILVEMQAGKTAEYSIRPVAVEGTFDIQEVLGLDGKHLAIYHLAAESVR